VHFSEERILESAAYAPLVDLMLLSVERQLVSELYSTPSKYTMLLCTLKFKWICMHSMI